MAVQEKRHVSYADAGVDVGEGARAVDAIKDAVRSTARPEVIGGLGGFGSCFSMRGFKNMEDPILVSSTDGVGTKLAIARLLDRHETVGQDLVAMCVDDIVPLGAEPLFFLDYVAVGKLRADHMAKVVSGIAKGCRLSGCALVGGEMAEHPGVMAEGDYDLAGFVVGVVDRPKMIGPEKVRAGDVILGLPSSGIHSNGYSLVRKVVIEGRGLQELERPLDELGGESIADAVMRPTTIYAGALVRVLRAGAPIHAMAHITGGGLVENVPRMLPEGVTAYMEASRWQRPPVFDWLQQQGGIDTAEMHRVFNCGIGMVLAVAPADVAAVTRALTEAGEQVFEIGEVRTRQPGEAAAVVA